MKMCTPAIILVD